MTNEEWQEVTRAQGLDLKTRDENALNYVMATPEGRWFIGRLLNNCHIFSSMSEEHLAVNEGERRVGLIVRNNIMSMPNGMELFHKMEKEMADVAEVHKTIREDIHKKYEGGYLNE